jgi:hypothetical protein
MECLGLHNKPKAEVHPGHKLMGPKEEEEVSAIFRCQIYKGIELAHSVCNSS